MKKVIFCLTLLFLLLGLPVQAKQPEMRGVWVSSVYNLDYPSQKGLSAAQLRQEADAIIANAKSWGLNAIFLQVRPSGDALYRSDLVPWSGVVSGVQGQAPEGQFDPLGYFVEQCHAQGLELHAWLNPYRLTRTAAASREEAFGRCVRTIRPETWPSMWYSTMTDVCITIRASRRCGSTCWR